MTVLKEQPPRLLRGIPLASNGLRKTFGQREVLKGIDLHIPAGQFVAIVGRSGCGKSTLLRLLAGLDQPSAGELLAGAAPLAEAREETRLMFQDARLLPWKKVIDNVGLGLSGNWRPRALDALEAVGLADRAHDPVAATDLLTGKAALLPEQGPTIPVALHRCDDRPGWQLEELFVADLHGALDSRAACCPR